RVQFHCWELHMHLGGLFGILGIRNGDMFFVIKGGVTITLGNIAGYLNRLAGSETSGLNGNLDRIVVPLVDSGDVGVGVGTVGHDEILSVGFAGSCSRAKVPFTRGA